MTGECRGTYDPEQVEMVRRQLERQTAREGAQLWRNKKDEERRLMSLEKRQVYFVFRSLFLFFLLSKNKSTTPVILASINFKYIFY